MFQLGVGVFWFIIVSKYFRFAIAFLFQGIYRFLSSPLTEWDRSFHTEGLDKQTHSDSNTL